MTLLLGIDLSTTGAKALLINNEGKVVGSATTALELSTPRPLWSEQEPRDWWQAATMSIRSVLDQRCGEQCDEIRMVSLRLMVEVRLLMTMRALLVSAPTVCGS
jgi:sugar (pentulose or hexulose) kinase